MGLVGITLDEVSGVVDGVVGAALHRLHERWHESASSVDRRTTAVLETARTVVRDHAATDDDIAERLTVDMVGAERVGNRFAPRIAP